MDPSNTNKETQNPEKMRRQRIMFQTKLQNKTPEKGQKEIKIANLLDKVLKVTVINMPTDLGKEEKY